MSASEFRKDCFALLDNPGSDGIIVTKRGKPVAKLIRIASDCAALIGSMKGKLKGKGSIYSTGLDWDAES